MKHQFKVASHEKGQRLLAFLRSHCQGILSVKGLKRCIERKQCRINGRVETFSTHILSKGDVVEIDLANERSRPLQPLLLWEDEFLAAYDKPAGVVSIPENFKGDLVHRLDKETSGVILVAKTQKILDEMIALFRKRQICKEYLALVDGLVHENKKTIISNLSVRHRYQGQVIYGSSSQGQEAITAWELVARGLKASLLLCKPVTGRTHQLRVHLKEAGHPILGDYQYMKTFYCKVEVHRHLLHAYKIGFSHPVFGDEIEIVAPVPLDFKEALREVGISDEILNH